MLKTNEALNPEDTGYVYLNSSVTLVLRCDCFILPILPALAHPFFSKLCINDDHPFPILKNCFIALLVFKAIIYPLYSIIFTLLYNKLYFCSSVLEVNKFWNPCREWKLSSLQRFNQLSFFIFQKNWDRYTVFYLRPSEIFCAMSIIWSYSWYRLYLNPKTLFWKMWFSVSQRMVYENPVHAHGY